MKNIAVLVFFVAALSSCAQSPTAPKAHDGQWWIAISKDQRIGFLSGFADCSINDVGEKRLTHFSAINEEPKITQDTFLSWVSEQVPTMLRSENREPKYL